MMSLLPLCLLFLVSVQTAMASDSALSIFSASLFSELVKENPNKNILVSPFSVDSALALVLLGARGETAESLSQAMRLYHLYERDPQSIHMLFAQILEKERKGSSVSIANYLMMQKESQANAVLTKYKSDAVSLYGARVDDVDFATNGDAIIANANNWVKDNTHGLIPSIINPPLDPATKLIILNAVHFEGKWLNPFESWNTFPRDFYNHGSEAKQVPFMRADNRFIPTKSMGIESMKQMYDVQAIELAYEKDDMSMVIILPDQKDGLKNIFLGNDLFGQINKTFSWTKNMTKGKVDITLPKFEFETEYNLNDAIKALGGESLFSSSADFSGINGRQDLSVSKISHKAKIIVDEEGTKAAAVTGIMMAGSSMQIERPIQFLADHPFLFFIRDNAADVILFVGTVEEL